MKYFSTLILVFLMFTAAAQTINKPKIEFTNTGIYQINKITITDTATAVEIKINFLPNWWTTISEKAYLENGQTNEKYFVKRIEGAQFNTKVWTPKSGDTLVKLIFPKIDKNIKNLNYGDEGKSFVFGISLKESTKLNKATPLPKHIQKWLSDKTALSKTKPNQSGFFTRDSIKIVGYIKGYDKRASFASGIIYHQNNITREDFPTTVRIYEDGRFECSMPAIHPITSRIHFNNQSINFYGEPGTTTGIILDFNDFLLADRYRELERFSSVVSHDLKSPLNNILLISKMLGDDYGKKLGSGGTEMVSYISASAQELKKLIDGILEHYKYAGLDTARKEKVRLRKVTQYLIDLFGKTDGISFVLPDDKVTFWANSLAFGQILYNLLANAIKYNDKEEPRLAV
ncbi:MAG: hypothetical protein EOO43_17525, partial [Flavobacterium sp.]